MNIKPIKTKKDYEQALKRIEQLWGAKRNTPNGDEFDVLCTLVESYEAKHYHIPPPDPIEAIKFRMEQMNLSNKDMIEFFGSRSSVSEVLSRKRNLTIKMIQKLHRGLGIPAESLIA
ncbi:MAG: DNA-binding protein [Bacteroidia bacterium]